MSLSVITRPLIDWYRKNARDLPWRRSPTPYHVWISEIMLQQTRVSAAIPYYERFLKELPDVEALAVCDDEKLMKLWEGLGYYSRARNLKKAAQKVVSEYGGVFPSQWEDLRSLPGIGDYTAGAISSIAFGLPEPAVDGNVLRIFTRITGDFSDISLEDTKKAFRERIRPAMPLGKTSEYTQALMELGATVCLPNAAPLCSECPVAEFCVARNRGEADLLPVKKPPKPRKIENRTVFFLFFEDKVVLRRRPEKGLLSGLWEFPNEKEPFDLSVWNLNWEELSSFGTGRHVFSHIEWHMNSRVFRLRSAALPKGFVFANFEELTDVYTVPSAFRDFASSVENFLKK